MKKLQFLFKYHERECHVCQKKIMFVCPIHEFRQTDTFCRRKCDITNHHTFGNRHTTFFNLGKVIKGTIKFISLHETFLDFCVLK